MDTSADFIEAVRLINDRQGTPAPLQTRHIACDRWADGCGLPAASSTGAIKVLVDVSEAWR